MNVVSIAPMLLCLLAHKSNGIAASEPWGMPRARAPFPTLCHRRARMAAGTRKRRSRYRSTCCKLVKLPLGWHGSGGGRMKGPAAAKTSRFELTVYVTSHRYRLSRSTELLGEVAQRVSGSLRFQTRPDTNTASVLLWLPENPDIVLRARRERGYSVMKQGRPRARRTNASCSARLGPYPHL